MSEYALLPQRWRVLIFCFGLAGVLLIALWPHPPTIPYLGTDGAQHAAAFVLLTLTARTCWPSAHWLRILAGLAGFGLAIEIMQGVIPTGRKPELADWLTDCAAIGLVLVQGELVRKARAWLQRGPR